MASSIFDNYEFSCSQLGHIISKSGKLTDGVKTFLNEQYVKHIYGLKKNISSKYFDKGKLCEEDGIDMLVNVFYKGKLVLKNKERESNGYINGEWDIDFNNEITDIKNAYDIFTFHKAELTWEYEWQLKGYCWLKNRPKARLFYTLINLPSDLLLDEKTKLFYSNKFKYGDFDSPKYIEDCAELEKTFNYDNIDISEKFKYWEIYPTSEDFERIKTSVIQARKYLNELHDVRTNEINNNKKLLK